MSNAKRILEELLEYKSLTRGHAREALISLTSGDFNPSQTIAFMTIYMMRNITIEELSGFRDAMLEMCLRVNLEKPVIDLCGTGGDGKNTFNISTLSAFVVAAAGQAVAKHGNYGVSSVSGSSNVLEYLGCRFTKDERDLNRSLEYANICVIHSPLFHPSMKNVAPYRKELGVKTFFNMLGPLVNPAFPSYQISGTFSLALARMYGYFFQQSSKKFTVLHSLDGSDEITLTSSVKCINNVRGEYIFDPTAYGYASLKYKDLWGGETVEDAAKIFIQVLEGKASEAKKNVIIANAAMALLTCQPKKDWAWAEAAAREALVSKKALQTFKKFIEFNQ